MEPHDLISFIGISFHHLIQTILENWIAEVLAQTISYHNRPSYVFSAPYSIYCEYGAAYALMRLDRPYAPEFDFQRLIPGFQVVDARENAPHIDAEFFGDLCVAEFQCSFH